MHGTTSLKKNWKHLFHSVFPRSKIHIVHSQYLSKLRPRFIIQNQSQIHLDAAGDSNSL